MGLKVVHFNKLLEYFETETHLSQYINKHWKLIKIKFVLIRSKITCIFQIARITQYIESEFLSLENQGSLVCIKPDTVTTFSKRVNTKLAQIRSKIKKKLSTV